MSEHECQNERIAVLESEVKNLSEWMKTVDARLHSVEKQIWIGFGLLIAAEFVLKIYIH